jgi:hypothetical protein
MDKKTTLDCGFAQANHRPGFCLSGVLPAGGFGMRAQPVDKAMISA